MGSFQPQVFPEDAKYVGKPGCLGTKTNLGSSGLCVLKQIPSLSDPRVAHLKVGIKELYVQMIVRKEVTHAECVKLAKTPQTRAPTLPGFCRACCYHYYLHTTGPWSEGGCWKGLLLSDPSCPADLSSEALPWTPRAWKSVRERSFHAAGPRGSQRGGETRL